MRERRLAREIAVQALYEIAQSGTAWQRALQANVERREAPPMVGAYAGRLVECVQARQDAIAARLRGALQHWDLERVALVDRCVLEAAAAEILFFPDVPVRVSIDEAVDVARKFSSDESGAFVNGVLDRIARDAAMSPPPAGALEKEA
jgi:N utilization substance protein B